MNIREYLRLVIGIDQISEYLTEYMHLAIKINNDLPQIGII